MHRRAFYRVVAMVVPLVLAGVARGSGYRWAATAVAGVYSAFLLLMGWILPLFPAQPKLGPVYQQVTQFVPPEFPMLLIVPALALDLLWQRTPDWGAGGRRWFRARFSWRVFAAVQWPFADFLMSPWARNWFFGTKYFRVLRAGPTSIVCALSILCAGETRRVLSAGDGAGAGRRRY